MNSWILYLITRLEGITVFETAGIVISGMGCAALLIGLIIGTAEDFDCLPSIKKYLKIAAICVFSFSFLRVFTPTVGEMAFIYLTPKVINNEQVQKIPENVLKLLNVKLEQYINDTLSKEVEKNKDKGVK